MLHPEDYMALAKERGMTFIGPYPTGYEVKTEWQCTNCGRTHTRSYKQMKSTPRCRCQGASALSDQHYSALGKALGIKWAGVHLPQRSTDVTPWIGYNDQPFEASFAILSRPVIPKRYREFLNGYSAPASNYDPARHTALVRSLKR